MAICKRILYVLCLILTNILVWAENPQFRFKHITTLDGLPDNEISGVFFLPDGRLAIRSYAALTIYDGDKFTPVSIGTKNAYKWGNPGVPIMHYVDSVDGLVWIKGRESLNIFDISRESFVLNPDSLIKAWGISRRVNDMFIDDTNGVWFLTSDGLRKYDSHTKSIGPKIGLSNVIGLNGNGTTYYIVGADGTIYKYDYGSKKILKKYYEFKGKIKPDSRVITSILSNGDVWLVYDHGVAYFDSRNSNWRFPEIVKQNERDVFTALSIDKKGNAYVGTGQSGFYVIDRRSLASSQYNIFNLADGSSLRTDISNIAIDRNTNDLWIALGFRGLVYRNGYQNNVSLWNKETLIGQLPNATVHTFAETPEGDILVGTKEGLYRYRPLVGKTDIPWTELKNKVITSMRRDSKDRIWIGTLYDGLYVVENGSIKRHYFNSTIDFQVFQRNTNYNVIRAIAEGSEGEIYVSVIGGVYRLNPENGKYTSIESPDKKHSEHLESRALTFDNNGQLIVGSNQGLYYYNPDKNFIWEPERDAPNDKRFLHTNIRYNTIFRDSRNLYWFGTRNGLNVVDMQKDSVMVINKDNGLSNNVIKTIIEDNRGDIWVSTSKGINKIKVMAKNGKYDFSVTPLNEYNGLPSGDYYENSGLKSQDGTIYFGGPDGFISFQPDEIVFSDIARKPVITGIMLFNSMILPGQKYNDRIIIDKAVASTDRIVLEHDENFITFEFTGLNYSGSTTYYRYRLEGYEERWNEVSFTNSPGRATYTGLKPGKYKFEVFAANTDNQWSELMASINVEVKPPFWDTTLAHIIYMLLGIGAIVSFALYIRHRNRKHMEEFRREQEHKRKEDLDQMKFRFFTNVSHEFRTPLTLIITPLEAYLKKEQNPDAKKKLSAIHRNALSLLDLVNQLLDFRKLEMKGEKLTLVSGDFVEFVRNIYSTFQNVADEKELALSLDTGGLSSLYMYFDCDKVRKIINNLLSNAFKFTPPGGSVCISLHKTEIDKRPYAELAVKDTGPGISHKELPHIFERFYQAASSTSSAGTPGSGIGLHLIKEYVEMHSGKVRVTSKLDKGTEFYISIPCDLHPEDKGANAYEATDVDSFNEASFESETTGEKPLIIVAEDNAEFREFLHEQLSDKYRVIVASDGHEAYDKAVAENPDLIVSDIMMPLVDGLELCRRIKTKKLF